MPSAAQTIIVIFLSHSKWQQASRTTSPNALPRDSGPRGHAAGGSQPGGTSRRSLSLTWDVSRMGVGFSRGECKHSVKRCRRGHGTVGHGSQGGTCVVTRGPWTAGGEWGQAGLASSPRPRPRASHAATPPHASRPAGCGRKAKKHGCDVKETKQKPTQRSEFAEDTATDSGCHAHSRRATPRNRQAPVSPLPWLS